MSISKRLTLLIAVLALAAAGPQPLAAAGSPVTGLEFLGQVIFPTGYQFQGTQVGGLSSIIYDAGRQLYYTISDDRSQFQPARYYALAIDLHDGQLNDGDIVFRSVTTLLDVNGQPYAPLSLDPEGLALTAQGTLIATSEGEVSAARLLNPFVREYALDGTLICEYTVGERYWAYASPDEFGVRNNLGFESGTVTPSGRYYFTATENALKQDGPAASLTTGSPARIIRYNVQTKLPDREYLYFTDPVVAPPVPAGQFTVNGIVEMLALSNTQFLVMERSFSVGVGNAIKLYAVSLSGATNILPYEDLSEADLANFRAARKTLLLDFDTLGLTLDNIEGMTFGPMLPDGRQSLIIVSDNNFAANQFTQFLAFAVTLD
jgi:hypothetical protein